MVESKKLSTYSWWFDSQNDNNVKKKSLWLQSTLAELDEKTESMLKLIEEDADSFAKRAEMYYKKRPQLINIIHDFYQTHRSLALRCDQATKVDSSTRLLTQNQTSQSHDSLPESFDLDQDHDQDSGESDNLDQQTRENQVSSNSKNDQVKNLLQEIERLKDENNAQKELLVLKDEEKREVIRQLSLSLDLLKQENSSFKTRIGKDSLKKQINVARVDR